MQVRIRYFASVREALGTAEEHLETDAATVGALRDELLGRGGVHAEVLARERAVRAAVDQEMVAEDAPLRDGAEVAFFPPVTGG